MKKLLLQISEFCILNLIDVCCNQHQKLLEFNSVDDVKNFLSDYQL